MTVKTLDKTEVVWNNDNMILSTLKIKYNSNASQALLDRVSGAFFMGTSLQSNRPVLTSRGRNALPECVEDFNQGEIPFVPAISLPRGAV